MSISLYTPCTGSLQPYQVLHHVAIPATITVYRSITMIITHVQVAYIISYVYEASVLISDATKVVTCIRVHATVTTIQK